MRRAGSLLAVCDANGRQEGDLHMGALAPEQLPQVRQQAVVVDERCQPIPFPLPSR